MGRILGYIYTSICYCCKSFPVLLHDVMVGEWIASYLVYRRARKTYIIIRRASEASLFFLSFPGKKKLFITGRTRILLRKLYIWWWMLFRTLRKVMCTNMRKNMHVVTPRCAAAAAVVSAVVVVVFRRPTKEYTHPYSMMHRRLTTSGIEVAPHYHQLLVGPYTTDNPRLRSRTYQKWALHYVSSFSLKVKKLQ